LKSIHDRLTHRSRLALIAAATLLATSLGAGCARRAANDWAQNAPAIAPSSGSVGFIGFGVWDDTVHPQSLDAISQARIALRH
jgi:hypothetical protein